MPFDKCNGINVITLKCFYIWPHYTVITFNLIVGLPPHIRKTLVKPDGKKRSMNNYCILAYDSAITLIIIVHYAWIWYKRIVKLSPPCCYVIQSTRHPEEGQRAQWSSLIGTGRRLSNDNVDSRNYTVWLYTMMSIQFFFDVYAVSQQGARFWQARDADMLWDITG